MKKLILALVCSVSLFACSDVPVQGVSPVSTTGQDLNSLAAQATQAWVDYQNGDVNYAWAATKGLYAYATIVKTKDDIKRLIESWSGSGTFAEKLARIFASSTASPQAKANALAAGISVAAAKN